MTVVLRSRALWLFLAVAAVIGGVASMPGADPSSFATGVPEVSAVAAPNPLWMSARETPALASIKANATQGTPAGGGPSANVGQTIQLKGAALGPGVASFAGYNGTPVTSPLTSVKVGKKGKAAVPPLAVTGDVLVVPDGGEPSSGLPLQIVPTISNLSSSTVAAGDTITVNGTGFDPNLRVVFPGAAAPTAPSQVDSDSAVVTVPAGVQKGKLKVTTAGGSSNTVKLKTAAAAAANRALATDPATGLILATDDVARTLSAIDPATGAVVREVTLGIEPSELWLDDTLTRAVVVADDGARVSVDLATWDVSAYDGAARTVLGGIDAERRPALFAIDPQIETYALPSASRVVALDGDRGLLYVLDAATLAPVGFHRFDGPVEGITIGLDGRAYTIDRASGRLLSAPVE
jgi:hypothetical protein